MSAESITDSIPAGYKQTEVGVIPEDWEIKKLGKTAILKARIGWQGLTTNEYLDSGDYYLVTGTEFKNGYIDWDNCHYVTDSRYQQDKNIQLKEHDILVTKDGTIGKVALINQLHKPATLNSGVFVIRPINSAFHPEFFYYLICSQTFTEFLSQLSAGSTINHLYQKDFVSYLYTTPPTLAEQEAIATALSDMDALIESLEQLIAKKRQIKQGAMQELLTGKRRLPGFSGEWETKLLDNFFEFSGGLSASRDQLSTEGYCYLHYGDIHTSNKNFIDVKLEKQDIPKLAIPLKKVSSSSLLETGDVVFVDASEDDEGASKHVVVFNEDKIPFISGLHTIVAKSKTNELDYHYRRYCFQNRDIKEQFRFFAVGTKVTGISKTNITKITLSIPPIPEQAAIATIISDMDAEITALEEKLAKTRQIKQGMMQELLTGRIRLV